MPLLKEADMNLSGTGGRRMSLEADRWLKDKEMLELLGERWKVLFTPGHTKGSVCYYIEEEHILFSGDTLFANSVGRTDFPGSSTSALIRSIQEKLMTLPDETRVYPGHMGETAIGHERVNNPFL